MIILIAILMIIVSLMSLYIFLLQKQIRQMNKQLEKRFMSDTRQPVSLELLNNQLNTLAANINKCLKAEETLRLESIRNDKKLRELIANISHDLRTPLTAVKGYLQLLENSPLSEEQLLKFNVIQKHTSELENLINVFFEYSHLISLDQELKPETFNLTNLVIECLAGFITEFENKNISVVINEMPPVTITADRDMVTRIVRNLVRNCIAHSDGSVEVTITQKKNRIITFKNPLNSSPSINIDRIFDRFYTADDSRSNTTGLGLSIVKILTEKQHGKVSASLENGFFEISIELP